MAVMRYTMAASDIAEGDWDANEIVDGLWVGNLAAANSKEHLSSRGITSVVTVAARLNPELPENVVHTEVKLDDHPCADLLSALPAALDAIDAALGLGLEPKGQVLVHCASGVSRSASACAAWLMTRRQLSLDESLRAIREVRPRANPNFGFMRSLKILEASGGDVAAAAAKWQDTNIEDFRDQVGQLRQAANAFHARVDALEEQIAQHRAAGGDSISMPSELKALLESLQHDIDNAAPQQEDDRVAQTIRRAAAQKVSRLLSLESEA
eukprot:TRINITY_DN14851_c0_g1_i1.p1 TRINITY_DN14851_c0_g1~~TRINITY_DN14851_c0_g1_i1.p1  ORF type:complete len:268 (+),score=46.99 TRINITY_DN14851_c0_g1_i1:129-932(+)